MNLQDFEKYFKEVNTYVPFPWQRRLAAQMLNGSDLPSLVSLPTGSGKTAILDIVIFGLAAQLMASDRRKIGRRIFYVVDRRLIVDQAYERAKNIAEKLANAPDGSVLSEVARNLRKYGGDSPLRVVKLRGAMYRDESWADSPLQPLVVLTTVDQIGSRLLFRGYGLSPETRPLHAGLVANDSLIILDEAHLSRPFAETLILIKDVYKSQRWGNDAPKLPFGLIQMSATKAGGFALAQEDRDDARLHDRLDVRKRARLQVASDQSMDFEKKVVGSALDVGKRGIVLVVLNTVNSARTVFQELQRHQKNVVLLTGRIRSYEKDGVVRRVSEWMKNRDNLNAFVVATQSIEVGADYDFDAIVTECASADVLVQRFGRVDRFGERGRRLHNESKNVVVIRRSEIKKPNWLYGDAMGKTWKWLKQTGFSFRPVDASQVPPDLIKTPERSPILLPAYLDTLAQTDPSPRLEPDVGLFLHGTEAKNADVQVVWRGDLDPKSPQLWKSIVSAFPPLVEEGLSLPIRTLKAWLNSVNQPPLSDVESNGGISTQATSAVPVNVLLWRGPRKSKLVDLSSVYPGNTIVVPASYGGVDEFGWNPESDTQVSDVAEIAYYRRDFPALRLHKDVAAKWFDGAVPGVVTQVMNDGAGDSDSRNPPVSLRRALEALKNSARNNEVKAAAAKILSLKEKDVKSLPHPSGRGWIVKPKRLKGRSDDDSDFARRVLLSEHGEGVKDVVRKFGNGIGFSVNIRDDLETAALLHDAGKADERFQLMLYELDEVEAASGGLLAKSGGDPSDLRERERVKRQSGYPQGARHEALSVFMAQSLGDELVAHDRDLVLHLIASHHGHARPFFSVVPGIRPLPDFMLGKYRLSGHGWSDDMWRLNSGVSDRFAILNRRYGYYGVAFLEAVLRLADHKRSSDEGRAEGD